MTPDPGCEPVLACQMSAACSRGDGGTYVTDDAIEAIVEARERIGGRFTDFYEFCEEIDSGRVNRKVIEALILAGALDSIPGRREQKIEALDLALARAQRLARDRQRGQGSLFGGDSSGGVEERSVLPDSRIWESRERLRRERELLGLDSKAVCALAQSIRLLVGEFDGGCV